MQHLVGAEATKGIHAGDGTGAQHQRIDSAARCVGQRTRRRDDLVRNLPQRAVALLGDVEDVHRTVASLRSSVSRAGTASAPSPTMRPACRSAGSSRLVTSKDAAPNDTGFTSSGFFFAAMMPLREGSRGVLRPLSQV